MLKLMHSLASLILTVFVFGGLFIVPAATTPPQNAPLPVPDVMFYGTATIDGVVVTSGTVTAVLPRGGQVSATIAPIQGTDYNYMLAVPLNVFDDPDTAELPVDAMVSNDILYFKINDINARYEDAYDVLVEAFTIPNDAMGETYILDLMIINVDNYVAGDVNVDGRCDVADALLMLHYHQGLASAGENFPPAPGEIYLPLCDIVANGLCDDADALRVLRCDVGIPTTYCPPSVPVAASTPSPDMPLVFRLVVDSDQGAGLNVRVIADDTERQLGAASLELGYDVDQLTMESCVQDPLGALDMGVCSASSARLNAVAITGASTGTVLAELTFTPMVTGSVASLVEGLELKVNDAFDLDGQALAWTSAPLQIATFPTNIFLPLILHDQAP